SASGRSMAQNALGGGEQRVCSVVLVGCVRDVTDGPTFVEDDVPTGVIDDAAPIDALRSVAAAHGGRLEALVDGSLLVVIEGGAREMAGHAARCALAIRAHLHGNPIALAT